MAGIFHRNSGFFISGEELSDVQSINWGNILIDRNNLIYVGDTGISGVMPPNAITSEVSATFSDGSVSSLGQQIVRMLPVDRVVVSPLTEKISGSAGEIVKVTGDNFYRITDIKFGGRAARFTVISPKEIEAFVPIGAEYGNISVVSSVSSGEAGTTFNSGETANEFIPFPDVESITPDIQTVNESITIQGFSLSSVTGVRFSNNSTIKEATSVTNTSFNVEVPANKASGPLTFLMQSGIEKAPISNTNSFSHFAVLDSVSPNIIRGGDSINLVGRNFHTGMLSVSSGNFINVKIDSNINTGFEVKSDTLIVGTVPSTLSTGTKTLSLMNEDGDIYPSGENFIITGNLPVISGFQRKYGATGSNVLLTGANLYSIRNVTLTNRDKPENVVTITGDSLFSRNFGDSLKFSIPSGLQSGYSSEEGTFYADVQVSGDVGASNVLESGFFVIGKPIIESVVSGVSSPREPSTELALSGLNLIRKSTISFFSSTTEEKISFTKPTSVTGSGNYVKQTLFTLPSEFNTTGIKAKFSGENGESNFSQVIPVYRAPFISGFEPLSGEAGTVVNMSGFFSGLKSDEVSINSVAAKDISQVDTTGITFKIPTGASSNFIKVFTSGGNAETTSRFSLLPDLPIETGFSPSSFEALTYSTFGAGQSFQVLGTNLNFVNEVKFYNSDLGDISVSTFKSKSDSQIGLFLPENVLPSPKLGTDPTIRLVDRFGRISTGTTQYRIAELASTSGSYGVFGDSLTFSGSFISGLSGIFFDEDSSPVTGSVSSSTKHSETGFSIQVGVPRDIISGKLEIASPTSPSIDVGSETFFPLPTITGITGNVGSNLNVGAAIQITGVNAFGAYKSGENVIGITGEQGSAFFPINSFSRSQDTDGKNVSIFDLEVGGTFTGSGQLFIMSPWEDYTSSSFDFQSSKTSENITKLVTSDSFNIVYPGPSISGIGEGLKFNENISGFISGTNLSPVTGVFFSGSGEGAIHAATDFTAETNTLIKFAAPFGSLATGSGFLVVQSAEGLATSEPSGIQVELISPIVIDSFSPLEGITGSTVNIFGSGFADTTDVVFTTVDHSGSASFTIDSSTGLSVIVPDYTISEGQDALITVRGFSTDNQTTSNRFTIIHDAPAVQFNVLSGRSAPAVGASRSAIFTIVETINGIDYYVTKMVNPDGKEIIMNTEQV